MIFFTWKRLPISSSISDFVSIFEMSILIRRPEFFVDSVLWMFCRARHISGTLKKRSSQGRYNTSKKIRHSWAAFFQQHFYIFFVLRFFLPNRTFVKHFLQKKTETSFCVCVVGFTSELHRPLKQTNLNWILLNDHRSTSNSDSLKNLIQTGLDSIHFNLYATSQTYYHQQIALHS
jgi:hypothetical protein